MVPISTNLIPTIGTIPGFKIEFYGRSITPSQYAWFCIQKITCGDNIIIHLQFDVTESSPKMMDLKTKLAEKRKKALLFEYEFMQQISECASRKRSFLFCSLTHRKWKIFVLSIWIEFMQMYVYMRVCQWVLVLLVDSLMPVQFVCPSFQFEYTHTHGMDNGFVHFVRANFHFSIAHIIHFANCRLYAWFLNEIEKQNLKNTFSKFSPFLLHGRTPEGVETLTGSAAYIITV